jgi:hypothetical protein
LGIDLGFGQPVEHVLRQSMISMRVAETLGHADEDRSVMYYTALVVNAAVVGAVTVVLALVLAFPDGTETRLPIALTGAVLLVAIVLLGSSSPLAGR